MRYQEIKKLVDELGRDWLRRLDLRQRNRALDRDVVIRIPKGTGDFPADTESFGPAYTYDRAYTIYKIIVSANPSAEFNVSLIGSRTGEAVTEATTYPYFYPTPILWRKGEGLSLLVNSSDSVDAFEALVYAREI